jgi:large subunit ribosomal protein L29
MKKHIEELRELSSAELIDRLNNAREELMNYRFQQSTGELTDFNQIKATRKRVARILTILRERELAEEMEGEE